MYSIPCVFVFAWAELTIFFLSLNGIRLDNIEFVISRSETYYSIGKFKIQGQKVTGVLQITLEFHFFRKSGNVDEINLGQKISGIFLE